MQAPATALQPYIQCHCATSPLPGATALQPYAVLAHATSPLLVPGPASPWAQPHAAVPHHHSPPKRSPHSQNPSASTTHSCATPFPQTHTALRNLGLNYMQPCLAIPLSPDAGPHRLEPEPNNAGTHALTSTKQCRHAHAHLKSSGLAPAQAPATAAPCKRAEGHGGLLLQLRQRGAPRLQRHSKQCTWFWASG